MKILIITKDDRHFLNEVNSDQKSIRIDIVTSNGPRNIVRYDRTNEVRDGRVVFREV